MFQEVSDELLVEVGKSEEGLHFLLILRSGPLGNASDLDRVHRDGVVRDDYSEVLDHSFLKLVRGTTPASASPSTSASRSWLAPCTYRTQPAIASNLPSASATLAYHVTRYLTRTDMYLPSSVSFIISVTPYISPYPQGILILSSSDPLLGMFMF